MKRALKKKSNIYSYLDSKKVLEIGTDEAIAKARKEYWKKYSAEWRRQNRRVTKVYSINYIPSEVKLVIDAAKKHKISTTAFIRKACFCYMNSRYLPIDAVAMNEISQLLAINYNALKTLIDDGNVHYQIGQNLIQQMASLEQRVNTELRNPKSLEQLIVEAMQANPNYKETIEKLLKKMSE